MRKPQNLFVIQDCGRLLEILLSWIKNIDSKDLYQYMHPYIFIWFNYE